MNTVSFFLATRSLDEEKERERRWREKETEEERKIVEKNRRSQSFRSSLKSLDRKVN